MGGGGGCGGGGGGGGGILSPSTFCTRVSMISSFSNRYKKVISNTSAGTQKIYVHEHCKFVKSMHCFNKKMELNPGYIYINAS